MHLRLSPVLLLSSLFTTTHAFATATPSNSRSMSSSHATAVDAAATDDRTAVNAADAAAEQAFLDRTKQLCEERNYPFRSIKNARDLASVHNSPIAPGKVIRMGRPGDASTEDLQVLNEQLQIKTLIDLRSPTELKEDDSLMREAVYGEYVDILWKEKGGRKKNKQGGVVRELNAGEEPLPKRFWHKKVPTGKVVESTMHIVEFSEEDDDVLQETLEDDANILECDDTDPLCSSDASRKERHFCSLMNEFKYVKGTVSKLRKRDLTKAILKTPGAMFSKRMRENIKQPFLDEINDGGLNMLNELLLRFGAPGIRYVLEIVADETRHPVAFYCTAGKDRTGALAAIILALCGAEPEDIVEDYTLSANVYAEMGDHKAMVGALSQRNLDPKTFLGAPPTVMRETLKAIANDPDYGGSVEGYCNWIGFGPEKQEQLRKACMKSGTIGDDVDTE